MAATAKKISGITELKPLPTVVPKRPYRKLEDSPSLGVVDQVRLAFRPRTRLATLIGCLLGGLVPMISFVLAHGEVNQIEPLYEQVASYLVLGGLLFSATTVYTWGRMAFSSGAKALGFVVLTEGALVLAKTEWLGWVALFYLCAINAIATGCVLALDRKE